MLAAVQGQNVEEVFSECISMLKKYDNRLAYQRLNLITTQLLLHNFIMTENPQKSQKSQIKPADQLDNSLYSNKLNNSLSKMQYSLSKSPRFKESTKPQHQPQFYQLPSLNSKRSASFGFGNKVDISKFSSNNPPPNSYNIHSEFQLKKNKGIGIGLGRELVKAGSAFGEKPFSVPGVGAYEIKELSSNKTVGLAGRLVDLSDKWTKQVPGPGSYKTLELLDKNLKSQLSKYGSARSHKFSKQENSGELAQIYQKRSIPGPGQYSASNKSLEFVEHYPKHSGASFSKSPRPDIAQKTGVPGPGSYRHLSEFIH